MAGPFEVQNLVDICLAAASAHKTQSHSFHLEWAGAGEQAWAWAWAWEQAWAVLLAGAVALVLAWGLALGQVQAVSKGLSRLLRRLLPKGWDSGLFRMATDELPHCKGMRAAGIPGMGALGHKRASLEGCSILDTHQHCLLFVALQCPHYWSPR